MHMYFPFNLSILHLDLYPLTEDESGSVGFATYKQIIIIIIII